MKKPGLLLLDPWAERLLDGALADRFDVLHGWEGDGLEALLVARGADVIAILTTRIDAALIARLPGLRLITVPGAGFEHVDVAAAAASGIVVANAGNAHSADVADHALALTIASVHRLPDMQSWLRDGRWHAGHQAERRTAMRAQRFGIVGLGHIGTAIAKRLAPFGGDIAWWGPNPKPAPWPRHDSVLDLARWCTVLIVATRGDADALVDAATIAAVGPEGLIINISRGRVLDEAALIAALKERRLGRAALDVFAEEPAPPERWRDVPNVILTPHVAGVSQQSMARLREVAIRNLTSILDGHPVVNTIAPPARGASNS